MKEVKVWAMAVVRFLPLLVMLAVLFAGVAAHAQGNFPTPTGIPKLPSPPIQSVNDVEDFICALIPWIFWGLIVLSVVMVLVGGYRYVTSEGDGEKVSQANKTLLYAAIAVVVALIAAGVPLIIDSFLGAGANLGNACTTFA